MSDPTTRPEWHDVVAVGNALVDILAPSPHHLPDELDLHRGGMKLVDTAESARIRDRVEAAAQVSGGSAANTAVGIASLGSAAAFVGCVADDELGAAFAADIAAAGVTFDPPRRHEPGDDHVTGHCVVVVTPDAERSMATHLGVAGALSLADVPDGLVEASGMLYLEGYLYESPSATHVAGHLIGVAHDSDGSVALSLSDPWLVEAHRREFLELLTGDLDVLFGNEEEMRTLFGASSLRQVEDALTETGVLAVVTRGAHGALVVTPTGSVHVAAEAATVVDATGAGDLFAAGFLHGLAAGADPAEAARIGATCAAEVISHLGARPLVDLGELATREPA